jgi:succinate-semialdehyde dehydrogenase/glutarate-semialdehyde dehydrogenase
MDETHSPERDQLHTREPANPPGPKPRLTAVDPATGAPVNTYQGHTHDEALEIARASRRAVEDWRRTSYAERARLMRPSAEVLRRRQDEFADLMTAEMGKLLKDGRAEVEKCAFNCAHFAKMRKPTKPADPSTSAGPRRS